MLFLLQSPSWLLHASLPHGGPGRCWRCLLLRGPALDRDGSGVFVFTLRFCDGAPPIAHWWGSGKHRNPGFQCLASLFLTYNPGVKTCLYRAPPTFQVCCAVILSAQGWKGQGKENHYALYVLCLIVLILDSTNLRTHPVRYKRWYFIDVDVETPICPSSWGHFLWMQSSWFFLLLAS